MAYEGSDGQDKSVNIKDKKKLKKNGTANAWLLMPKTITGTS